MSSFKSRPPASAKVTSVSVSMRRSPSPDTRGPKRLQCVGEAVNARPMKVTLHQVAARAGVSIATASRALNGLAVSAPAQNRVRQAVAELGYVANEAARSLRSDRTLTMGLIFFDLRNN